MFSRWWRWSLSRQGCWKHLPLAYVWEVDGLLLYRLFRIWGESKIVEITFLRVEFLSVCLSVCLSVRPSVRLSIYLSIYLPIYLSIYFCSCFSHLEHRASVKRFVSLQFLNLRQSVGLLGKGISQTQGHYLHRRTQTQNKRRQTSMSWMGFEPTIPEFERTKTFVGCRCWRDNHVLIFYTVIYCHYAEHTDELQLER
jgi:hypothetical protein